MVLSSASSSVVSMPDEIARIFWISVMGRVGCSASSRSDSGWTSSSVIDEGSISVGICSWTGADVLSGSCFGWRSCSTNAGRASGSALAIAATAVSVGLMEPESNSFLIPGSISSAASTPIAYRSARRTYRSFVLFSRAILSAVFSTFWWWTFCPPPLSLAKVCWFPWKLAVCFSASYRCPIRYFFCCGVRFRRPSWLQQIQAMAA